MTNQWRRALTASALAAAALTTTFHGIDRAGAAPTPDPRPLDILLTNDDGVNAGYMNIVRGRLCDAGHRVTVVAPSGDQSGNSSRFTSARDAKLQITTSTFACGTEVGQQYAVASTWTARLAAGGTYSYAGPASPVDAVRFALSVLFADASPDVVISGANPGQNLSSVVLKSGTVGAAMTAAAKGIPAVALSVAFNPADDPRAGFPAATAAAHALGQWTTRLLDQLQQRSTDGRLLPHGVSLNVNYPTALDDSGAFAPSKVGDAVLTVAGKRDLIPIWYVPTANAGEYAVQLTLCGFPGSPAQCDEPEIRDADTTAIDQNRISVQPMDGDVSIIPPASTGLQRVLNALNT